MRNFFGLFFACVSVSGQAVVATVSKSRPLTPDQSWSFVGSMGGASAVAIGPHTVLTAGHVAAGDFILGSQTYRFASSTLAPSVKRHAVDLRVVQLSDTLPGWYQPAKSVSTKSTVTMVGFGETGVVNSADSGYAITNGLDERRAGQNTISSKTTTSSGPSLIAMLDKAGKAALAGGDSGGGWFVNGKLVGISAFTYTKDVRKPSYGFAKKAYFGSGAVDLTNSTIANWLRANTSRGMPIFASRTQAVPEPGSVVGFSLGTLLLVRSRKRKL